MVTIRRGQVWWVDFGRVRDSGPAKHRPAVVVQSDAFNGSKIATAVVVPLTGSVALSDAPGNVLISRRRSKLPKDSVANVSAVASVDRSRFGEFHGELPSDILALVDDGLRLALDLH